MVEPSPPWTPLERAVGWPQKYASGGPPDRVEIAVGRGELAFPVLWVGTVCRALLEQVGWDGTASARVETLSGDVVQSRGLVLRVHSRSTPLTPCNWTARAWAPRVLIVAAMVRDLDLSERLPPRTRAALTEELLLVSED